MFLCFLSHLQCRASCRLTRFQAPRGACKVLLTHLLATCLSPPWSCIRSASRASALCSALLCSAPIRLIRFSSLLSITQKRHRVLKKKTKKNTLKPSQFHSGQPAGQNKTPLPPCLLEMLFTLRLSLEADGIKAASDAQY